MIRSVRSRASISAGTALALSLFALAGAWHHHALSLPDDRALDRPEHGIAAGPCHVCKLSTAGMTLPSPEPAGTEAASSVALLASGSFPPTRSGFEAASPARAPPANA